MCLLKLLRQLLRQRPEHACLPDDCSNKHLNPYPHPGRQCELQHRRELLRRLPKQLRHWHWSVRVGHW